MWFWRIFHTELSIACFVYIRFIWHSREMTKQFFNFLKHICIDSYCISQLGYTLQILFLLPFPLTALTESQPEIASRAGRLSNTPSNRLLVPISRIITFEPTPIWTIKRQFIFFIWKAARMAISPSTVKIVILEQPTFPANWVARKTFSSASCSLELDWFNWIHEISFWSHVILYS